MNASTRMIMTQWTPKTALKAFAHVLVAASVISLMCGGTSLYVVDAMRVLAQPDMDSDAMIAEVGTFHTTEKDKKHNTIHNYDQGSILATSSLPVISGWRSCNLSI